LWRRHGRQRAEQRECRAGSHVVLHGPIDSEYSPLPRQLCEGRARSADPLRGEDTSRGDARKRDHRLFQPTEHARTGTILRSPEP
jgi:hypothetical protein